MGTPSCILSIVERKDFMRRIPVIWYSKVQTGGLQVGDP